MTRRLHVWIRLIHFSIIREEQDDQSNLEDQSVQSLSHVLFATPMHCSTPGVPVHHQLPELIQTHVYRISDAIQPSHPLSSPSFPTFNLSQHQGLFLWVRSSHQVAKYWSFSISPSSEYSGLISFSIVLVGSPCSPRDSQVSSPTPQFKCINSSVLNFLYSPNLKSIHDY